MSGVANPASDVIIVMGDDPDGSGGGYHRPQRKRVRTTKVLEMEQQNGDMEWQEEGETSEGALGQNRAQRSSKLPCQMLMSHPISSNNDTDTNYNKNNN
ncbi:hypothetical protein FOFC_18606 [Fusarium oxysporum]|nr:hypothetical protein FOFC_18606 [Fusarium oxysporum]